MKLAKLTVMAFIGLCLLAGLAAAETSQQRSAREYQERMNRDLEKQQNDFDKQFNRSSGGNSGSTRQGSGRQDDSGSSGGGTKYMSEKCIKRWRDWTYTCCTPYENPSECSKVSRDSCVSVNLSDLIAKADAVRKKSTASPACD